MLSLTVLGASAVRPNPGGACAGYLLRAGSRRYLLDCGFGVLSRLMAAGGVASLDGVFVTHAHPDHCADLLGVHMALRYAPSETRSAPLPVYAGPPVLDTLRGLGAPFGQHLADGPLAFADLDASGVTDVSGLGVRIAPADHSVPCWAMRLEHEGVSVVYTGDTGPSRAIADLARGTDLLLAEATLLDRREGRDVAGHLSAAEAGCLAEESAAGRLLLTHYYVEYGLERLRAAAAAAFAGPVEMAREGETYVVQRG